MLRRALFRAIPAAIAFVGGVVLSAVAGTSAVLVIIGLTLAGLGAVALVSLIFYEVGLSEDREREREERREREEQLGRELESHAPHSQPPSHELHRRGLERRSSERRWRGRRSHPPHDH